MKYNEIPEVNTLDQWTATNHNTYLRENLMIMRPDVCIVARDATQSIPDGLGSGATYLSFNAEVSDTAGMHDNSTNPERVTILRAGIYLISASRIKFTAHASGYDICYLVHSDGGLLAEEQRAGDAAIPNEFHLTAVATLAVDDYIRVGVQQSSGGALDIMRVTNRSPRLSVVLLKDLTA